MEIILLAGGLLIVLFGVVISIVSTFVSTIASVVDEEDEE